MTGAASPAIWLALREIGTALYRAYLQRLIPEVRAMRAEIDAEAAQFPDLLARSSEILCGILSEAVGDTPLWARPLGFSDYFGIRHRRFRDQLTDMLADPHAQGHTRAWRTRSRRATRRRRRRFC